MASGLWSSPARQSRLARNTSEPITAASTRGRRSVAGVEALPPGENLDDLVVVIVDIAQVGGEQDGRGIDQPHHRQVGGHAPVLACRSRSEIWNALRAAVSGSSCGGRPAKACAKAVIPSRAKDRTRSSLLAK